MSMMREWVNLYLQKVEHHMYVNHCEKFIEYIEHIDKGNRPRDISKHDLIECVGYYNEIGKINTVSTMSNHLEAVKSFYESIQKDGKSDNIFNDISGYDEFKEKIARKYKLNDKVERDSLPNEVIRQLLEFFEENKDSKWDMIRLFIKLTLIAPAKRNIIADLKFSDFRDDFRVVIINDINIDIPNSLRRDLLNICCNDIEVKYSNKRLFEYIYPKKYNHNVFNRPLYKVLKIIDYDVPVNKSTFSVETIMNTAIITMIKNNTNPLLISKINGTSIANIADKVSKLGIEVNNYNQLINISISQADYYKYI